MPNPLSRISFIGAGSVVGLFISGYVAKQLPIMEKVSAKLRYESADLGAIDLRGVCSISPETVDCWNGDGRPDSQLAEDIKAFYLVNPNSDLHYKFGFKSRMVVFKLPSHTNEHSAYVGTATMPDGRYLQQAGQLGANGSGNPFYTSWYAVDAEPHVKQCSVMFNIYDLYGWGTLPLRQGAGCTIASLKLHVDSIKPLSGPPPWNPLDKNQKYWIVSLSISGLEGATYPDMSGFAVDSAGNRIAQIDEDGVPVGPGQPRKTAGSRGTNNNVGVVSISGSGTANQQLFIGVDPSKVPALRINPTGTRQVTITDIPLEPAAR